MAENPPPDTARVFTFRRPLGQTVTVHAERVDFTAHHVVFSIGDFIVKAERAESVNEMREVDRG